jgi:glycine hydroxymethyltransferase
LNVFWAFVCEKNVSSCAEKKVKNLIFDLIEQERQREETTINLIASENYASPDVLKAAGSVLTNKYAEGYPNKRYYGGCEIVDKIEELAIDLCKKVFNAEHANVQPHSGSSANMAVYFSQLNTGDTVLGMDISAGGHLTHGHKINFSGKLYNFVGYGVKQDSETIDYEQLEKLANQHKPKLIVCGASAYSRVIDFEKISTIAKSVGALMLADIAHISGLIAAQQHPSPVQFADFISSTTQKTLRGPRGGFICCKNEFSSKLNKEVMPGMQGGPLMHIIAAKAVCFEEALQPEFKIYQQQVIKNSKAMVKAFQNLGYRIVSGGTDNHLFMVDLRSKSTGTQQLTGRMVEELLAKCNITINRNLVPFDTASPMQTSGIRIGTPAITTRGFKESDAEQIVHWTDEAIKNKENLDFLAKLKDKVLDVCKKHCIYR